MIEIPTINQTRGYGKTYKTLKDLSEENSKLKKKNEQFQEKINKAKTTIKDIIWEMNNNPWEDDLRDVLRIINEILEEENNE